MNQTDVMLRIVEMAKVGGALPPDEAMSVIVGMINRLEVHSETYELEVAALMKVGATIWDLSSGPDGAHDPEWAPPFLRP